MNKNQNLIEFIKHFLKRYLEYKLNTKNNSYLESKNTPPKFFLRNISSFYIPKIEFILIQSYKNLRDFIKEIKFYDYEFKLIYIILPKDNLGNSNLFLRLQELLNELNLNIGIIFYDPSLTEIFIINELKIPDVSSNNIKFNKREWIFWADINLKELSLMIKKVHEVQNRIIIRGKIKKIVLNEIFDELLQYRFPNLKRPSSIKLNYKLFFNTLNIWDENGKLTEVGQKLHKLNETYSIDSPIFIDALSYIILMDGGYLKMLTLIDLIQNNKTFESKGNVKKLNSLIRSIRTELGILKLDRSQEKKLVLPRYEKTAKEYWLKTVGCELFKMGLGRSLTQLNEELNRRFGMGFQTTFHTSFYLNSFNRNSGYSINWPRIIDLIEKGEDNFIFPS